MKLKVPFVKNKNKWKGRGWCGPLALASILRYYKNKSSVEEIVKGGGTKIGGGGGTSPRGLAFFCLSKGLKVEHTSKYPEVKLNRKEFSERWKQFYREINGVEDDLRFRKKCEKFPGYKFIKKEPTLKLVEKYITNKKPVLLSLNIAVVLGSDKLGPHYVVAVGYDRKNLYVHNVYPKNQAYQKISKRVFEKAWRSDGMDKLLIVPCK